jgi:hypothetical protein
MPTDKETNEFKEEIFKRGIWIAKQNT